MTHIYSDFASCQYDSLITPMDKTFESTLFLFFRRFWHAVNNNFEWPDDAYLVNKFYIHLSTPYVSPIDIRTSYVFDQFRQRVDADTFKPLAPFEQQLTLPTPFTKELWRAATSTDPRPKELIDKILENNKDSLSSEDFNTISHILPDVKEVPFPSLMHKLDEINRTNLKHLLHSIALGISSDDIQYRPAIIYAIKLVETFLIQRGWDLKNEETHAFDIFHYLLNLLNKTYSEPTMDYNGEIEIADDLLVMSDTNQQKHYLAAVFLNEEDEVVSYVYNGKNYHATNLGIHLTPEQLKERMLKFKIDKESDVLPIPTNASKVVMQTLSGQKMTIDNSVPSNLMAALYKISIINHFVPYFPLGKMSLRS